MQLGPNNGPNLVLEQMGFPANGNTWTNCNGPMTFRKRNERIDWRKIAAIDLERISRELDFDTLQDNITNVAFCNIECELDPRCCDPNYTKLFRLAQLIIEYLLHSQDYLSHTVVALEEKCRYLTKQLECEKKSKSEIEGLIKSLKDDVKKYKKLFCLHKNTTKQQASADCHPCPFCPKIFLSPEYLQMHLQRRHLDSYQPEQQNQVATVVEKLEKEVLELKEQLHLTQCQLQDERRLKVGDDIQEWKVQQLESQKKEIESIRDLFMKEMRDINDRTTFAEYCVNNLQKELHDVCNSPTSSPPPCHVPIVIPTKDENCDMLKGQKKEFCKLRKSLTQHVEDVVCQQLKAHEDTLQKRIKCLAKEQTQELEKLNCLVQEKICKPDKTQTENLLYDLFERTKEQERKLKKHQRKIEELSCKPLMAYAELEPERKPELPPSPKPEPKPCLKSRKVRRYICRPHCYPYHHLHCRPIKSKCMFGIGDSDLNSNDSLQPFSHKRNTEALKNNKSLVEDLREELSYMLQEKLDNMGIPSKQSNTPTFHKKQVKNHPRSKSWSGVYNTEEEDDESEESDESEIVETVKPIKRGLPRSPSMPIPSVVSKESAGEWKRKVEKPSRLLSTKQSFSKLVTSVKKKFKPGKFWQIHSTPKNEKKQKQTVQLAQNESTISATSAIQMQSETEHEVSEEEEEEDEDEDDEESEDDQVVEVQKVEEIITKRPSLKSIIEDEEHSESRVKKESTSEWGSSSELEEIDEKIIEKSPQTTAKLFTILPQKGTRSPVSNISETAKKLEAKLTGTRTKPFGGVDTMSLKENKVKQSISLEDFDSTSESEKEDERKKNNPNLRQGITRNDNAWDKKEASKASAKKKAPVKSMYDWDSDEDISEIT